MARKEGGVACLLVQNRDWPNPRIVARAGAPPPSELHAEQDSRSRGNRGAKLGL